MPPENVHSSPGVCCVWGRGGRRYQTWYAEQVTMQAEMPFGCVEMTAENWAPRERGRWKPREYGLQNQPMPGQARKMATAGGLSCPSDCGGGITRKRLKIQGPVVTS